MRHPRGTPEPALVLPGLDESARARLETLSRPASWSPGAVVFREGEPARRCWILHGGRVTLRTAVPGRGDVKIESLTGGDVLGWSWLRPPHVWDFAAVADAPTDAWELDVAVLRAAADADPAFGYALTRSLAAALLDRLQATRVRLLDLYANPGAAS